MTPKEYQNVEIAIIKKASQIFADPAIFRQIGQELCKHILKLIIERILAGYDLFSRRFGEYNVSYKKAKAYEYAAKKYGTTQWASRSPRDKLRLTGNLLSSLDAKLVGVETGARKVVFKIMVGTKDPSQIPKILGLQSTTGVARNYQTYSKKAYLFMGLALSGSWKTKEERSIQEFLLQKLQEIITKKVQVKRA